MTTIDRSFLLRSGRSVDLRTPQLPLVRHYHVLAWPKQTGPATPAEIDEMWSIAHAFARERGTALFGDPECFTVLYNGARTRRMPWPHFHVIPARTPGEKRWVLLCLSLKRLLRPRRWSPNRSAGQSPADTIVSRPLCGRLRLGTRRLLGA